jgi:hypothetical protein
VRRLITLVSVTCLAVAALSRPAVLDVVLRAQEPRQVSSSSAAAAPNRAPKRASTAVPSHAAPVSTPPIITTASVKGFETTVKPFLSEFCFGCHGNKGEAKNGLNLQSFESAGTLIDQRNHWEDVVGMLKRGEMPPMEEEQPEDAKRRAVAGWLERELARIDRVTPPDPGRVTARRLNRAEYNNTVRELLGVNLRPADDFPQDDAGYGFDNIADVLSLSPVLME